MEEGTCLDTHRAAPLTPARTLAGEKGRHRHGRPRAGRASGCQLTAAREKHHHPRAAAASLPKHRSNLTQAPPQQQPSTTANPKGRRPTDPEKPCERTPPPLSATRAFFAR